MHSVSLSAVRRVSLLSAVLAASLVAGFLPGRAQASSDPLFAAQWSLTRIGAPAAWAESTGAGVRIGIVDTGVDLMHEDLASQVVASTNCIGSKGDPSKCTGTG